MRFLAPLFVLLPVVAGAQGAPLNVNIGNDLLAPERIFQLIVLITVLSLAPALLMMVTSFTRIIVVMAFLRSALGLQTTPPNSVLISLALFLTFFIMAPTFQASYTNGIKPYLDKQIEEEEAFERGAAPFKVFMFGQVREKDLDLFISFLPETDKKELAENEEGLTPQNVPIQALIPAFMISELRRAFEIGFLLFLPFLVIDLAIASILMAMGMMMLPPVIISLPFKIIFFVLVDGWHLLAGSLVQSFTVPIP